MSGRIFGTFHGTTPISSADDQHKDLQKCFRQEC